MTTYLRNAWYMAAGSEELHDQLLARQLFNRPVVLFRDASGGAKAIADRCPHRFAPLSLGEKQGDAIVCPYHGLTFDGAGHCVRNPFSKKILIAALVDAWACVERHGIVWLWGGDRSAADASLIPDFAMVDDTPSVRVVRGYTLLQAPYEFGTDNLLDLSHIECPETDDFLRVLFGQAFEDEDKPIITAAYRNLEGEHFWAAKPLSLGIDAGGTRARPKIEAMLASERAA